MEDTHICCSVAGMEILDHTVNPEGLSVQNLSSEDENQDQAPISENVGNSGDHQIPGIRAGLISKGKKKKTNNENQASVCESGRLLVPLLIAPGKGLNISANFSIIFCKSWAAQVPGGFV